MIELGRISIEDESSIVEARNKIRILAEDLKFDSFDATKFATITSELSRIIYQKGGESSIMAGFDKKEEGFGLVLIFQSKKGKLNIGKAGISSDELSTFQTKDGFQRVEVFKYIPDPDFRPTEDFINTERERLIRLSKAELLHEVNRKNEELLKLLDKHKQTEEELIATREAVETVSHAKSEFLASMSHELRTPLNAIIGFSEILQHKYFGKLNKKQAEYVKDILESGKHLLALINDILDLSKVEAGKMELELSPVNIKALLEGSLIMIKEESFKHGITLDIHIPQELAKVKIPADERKLKQVMFNLLSNAAKFSPDGGAIDVEARKEGEELMVSVSDAGIGIAPEHQEKIFEDFYQVYGGIKDKTSGTGLGLPLTRRLVEMHGGRIWVESEGKGKGSRVSFTLPMKREHLEQGEPVEKKDRIGDEVTIEESLLHHLRKLIYFPELSKGSFTLCRMHTKPKLSKRKVLKIKKALERVKRASDFLAVGKDGDIYLILQDSNSKKNKAAYNRLLKRIMHVFDGLNVSCSIAVFPDDGKNPKELIRKVRVSKK